MNIQEATDLDLEQALRSTNMTIVDFTAPWCAPCRTLLPMLQQISEERDGGVSVLKVNVDESPHSASVYGILSVPTVILFKDGEPVEKLVGLRPKAVYDSLIDKYHASVS